MREFFASLWSALKTHWTGILLTVGVAAFAVYLLVDRNTFASHTEGTIFIETPQIYTRERLVNDRFVQESWLREVLKVDPKFAPTSTVSIVDQRKREVTIGSGEQKGSGDARAADPASGTAPALHPAVDFLARNSYRELIRSHLIENQLDDRHDIRGTTIYMLKFDLAIVPGNNTRKPAFVRVRITRDAPGADAKPAAQTKSVPVAAKGPAIPRVPDDCPADEGARTKAATPEEYFVYYTQHFCQFAFSSSDKHPILLDFDLYNQWRASLRDRLTTALQDVLSRFHANKFRDAEYSDFLAMLAESGAQDWFSHWANSLSMLQSKRDALRETLGSSAPLVTALDHRFDFLAKSILITAVDRGPIDIEQLQKDLEGRGALPEPRDDSSLREHLLRYAVRRIGMAVVGDPTFQIEKNGETREIRSKTLDRFVFMSIPDSAGERSLPEIGLEPREVFIHAFRRQEPDNLGKAECQSFTRDEFDRNYALFGNYQETAADGKVDEITVFRATPENYFNASWLPGYILTAENLKRAFSKVKTLELPPYGKCLASAKAMTLPIGFLNFVANVVDIQTYTYATLPRLDLLVADTSNDSARQEGLSGDVAGTGAAGSISNFYRRIERAVEAKTSIIGFSGSTCSAAGPMHCSASPPPSDELNFGWVMAPPGGAKGPDDVVAYRPMQPTQRSLSALITVPTWWKRANLEVTTGWVRPDGSFEARPPQRYEIPLPIDFESLDAILTEPGRRDSRRPSIALERLPENLYVQACARAEILVPGHRLWRSSVVVLGGQRADEVTVLPDMRGIIATFKEVAAKRDWEKNESAVRKLQVWTSEGVAQEMVVKINAGGKCKDEAALDPAPAR